MVIYPVLFWLLERKRELCFFFSPPPPMNFLVMLALISHSLDRSIQWRQPQICKELNYDSVSLVSKTQLSALIFDFWELTLQNWMYIHTWLDMRAFDSISKVETNVIFFRTHKLKGQEAAIFFSSAFPDLGIFPRGCWGRALLSCSVTNPDVLNSALPASVNHNFPVLQWLCYSPKIGLCLQKMWQH